MTILDRKNGINPPKKSGPGVSETSFGPWGTNSTIADKIRTTIELSNELNSAIDNIEPKFPRLDSAPLVELVRFGGVASVCRGAAVVAAG